MAKAKKTASDPVKEKKQPSFKDPNAHVTDEEIAAGTSGRVDPAIPYTGEQPAEIAE